MSYMNEYLGRNLGPQDLENELQILIANYNKLRSSYLFVFASAIGKSIPGIGIDQSDYFVIHDLLRNKGEFRNLDFYLETPGGSAEAVEEIVGCLHKRFENVSFIISGEAKSAGTIMALSGDEILMTETGSLGPIDAQIRIGRAFISAFDYMEWVNNKREDALKNNSLNPFDAVMVAQISPGELMGVHHSLRFAEDLVVKWLPIRKFKNWNFTETAKRAVTPEMKQARATEIANELLNHALWRSHGRSIKRDDLEQIGLKITNIDQNMELADLVYRIQTVCRLLFDSSTCYKIYATEQERISKHAARPDLPLPSPQKGSPDLVEIQPTCPKCGKKHNMYAKLKDDPRIDADFQKRGFTPFPLNAKLVCQCGFEMDLSGIKNQIEIQSRRKIIS